MKTFPILVLTILIVGSCSQQNENTQETSTADEVEMEAPKELLRHVVLFSFKETSTEEDVEKIEKAFADLPNKISEIHSFEWGTNNSPEDLNKGLTHCFLVTFLSEEDRDIYLPHPAHQEFVALVGPHVEDVTVVDYWTK